jgi:hypothetical protein
MRYLTLNVDKSTRIDIDNSIWTGMETIMYNGNEVSKHWSLFGSSHDFEVIENGKTVKYEVRIGLRLPLRIGFDIIRDNEVLLLM